MTLESHPVHSGNCTAYERVLSSVCIDGCDWIWKAAASVKGHATRLTIGDGVNVCFAHRATPWMCGDVLLKKSALASLGLLVGYRTTRGGLL